ncbi:U32 family peptidase [Xylanibacillus composti]|uniref:Collagenase n=1 Tax=Xylanibacillus composti TaxID=1572762 RepID=A0A8J4H623_9BACL|nr:peptidase U32 family protein [Xylanibacillus composti]MDT9724599.1 U32 family peptidase [Xylanibacillus composti]GIQ71504.1 collagenase [Xylanibacillus composti]
MKTTPELLATARSIDEIKQVADAGADAVVIGESRFGVRLPGDIPAQELEAAIAAAREKRLRVYVAVNHVFANEQLPELRAYIQLLQQLEPDALVFGDPAVLMICRDLGYPAVLHWNPEMTSTNYATAQYWGARGAKRVVLARELNLEEIAEIADNVQMEVQVQVHGMTTLYHSGRKLIQSYIHYQGANAEPNHTGKDSGFYLVEQERKELRFPIYEDRDGTHIMSAEDICLLEVLDELLAAPIHSLKVEGLLKTSEAHVAAVRSYREALDAWASNPDSYDPDPAWMERIRQYQDPNRELTYGFLFKEQVY